MARNASGTYSLPAGNPVTTGTTINSTVQNNTTADLATELTDSLCRSGKGSMLAPLPLAAGTVSLPGLTFDSDTDTGLYRIGANNPGMAVGGAKIQEWASTGSTIGTGDFTIPAASNYKYASAVTRYAIASAADMHHQTDTPMTLSATSGVLVWTKLATAGANLYGTVKIPAGSTVTGVKIFATNTDGGNKDLTCHVHMCATDLASTTDGFTETAMASSVAVTLVDATHAWRDITISGGPHTLGAEGRIVYRITVPATTGTTTISVYALRFAYTHTTLVPAI
jgi:hypothetical protein